MLQFANTSSGQSFVVTLTELATFQQDEEFYFLFVFTHIETKEVVKKIFANLQDESDFKYRYNKWTIDNVALFFQDAPVGKYNYGVYEQLSPTDESTDGKNLIENGKMVLLPSSNFQFEKYNTDTSYKSYNG